MTFTQGICIALLVFWLGASILTLQAEASQDRVQISELRARILVLEQR